MRLMNRVRQAFLQDDSGVVALYVAIGLVVLLGGAALAVDIAHLVSVKRELTKAAEAGALSGARALWPMTLPVKTNDNLTPDCANAVNVAKRVSQKNQVDGSNLASDAEIIAETGRWDYASRTFTPGATANANSVRVKTLRDGVTMFLAPIFGISSRNASASAIAVSDFVSGIGPGCLPICIDKNVALDADGNVNAGLDVIIHMTPDTTDIAGWFVVPPDSACAASLKEYVAKDSCPAIEEGSTINLQNGADASVLAAINEEFNNYHGGTSWFTVIPTVDTMKYNQNESIVNFVGLEITLVVNTTSNKRVYGKLVKLTDIASGLPGGVKGGVLAPPKLVQ
jgi:Flp pilus assembly protein TadG